MTTSLLSAPSRPDLVIIAGSSVGRCQEMWMIFDEVMEPADAVVVYADVV